MLYSVVAVGEDCVRFVAVNAGTKEEAERRAQALLQSSASLVALPGAVQRLDEQCVYSFPLPHGAARPSAPTAQPAWGHDPFLR